MFKTYRFITFYSTLRTELEPKTRNQHFENFENITNHLKSQFSYLAPIHGDESLFRELQELKDLNSQKILDLLLTAMQDKVHYENFQDAWCSGMLIGQTFISWDVSYTFWLFENCFIDLFQSRFVRVFSSLANSIALDKLLDTRTAALVWLNPLWDLKNKSNVARCYSACREDVAGYEEEPIKFVTKEIELVVVLRLHDYEFHQSAIDNHLRMMTGQVDAFGGQTNRDDYTTGNIPTCSADFLEKFLDTSIVNTCVREGQTINLLKTIVYAAAMEQHTQNFIKTEVDEKYIVSIHSFDYASHFNKSD